MTSRALVENLYPSARIRELGAGANHVYRVTEDEDEFSIVKDATTGVTTRSCTTGGEGGCQTGGKW